MLGLRPKLSQRYLERPRLLRLLPEEAGYVVWLEAPYGYGKSVLATQWAGLLEAEGWRVLWLALQGREPRTSLARLLKLPGEAPWGILLESLWQRETLLVIEDLTGDEDLSHLLKHLGGLVLLASRQQLSYPELLSLATDGRLIHLKAQDLAFSYEEARGLFAEAAQAQSFWQQTQGWALPLHFAALTGENPEQEALTKGIKDSLSPAAWQEALFLAALELLPEAAATAHTEELARAGFVQSLEQGYRLHPLAAEGLQANYLPEMRQHFLSQAERVPLVLRGEALKQLGLYEALSALLESKYFYHQEIHENPEAFIIWDKTLASPKGPVRRFNVAIAQSLAGHLEIATEELLALAQELQVSQPEDALYMLGLVAYDLATRDSGKAIEVTEFGIALLDKANDQETAFRYTTDLFLNNAAWAYEQAGNLDKAESYYQQVLERMDLNRPDRVITLANLAHINWLRRGDLEAYIQAIEAMLPYTEAVATYNLAEAQLELGKLKKLLAQRQESLVHFQKAQSGSNPLIALEAQAEEALLISDEMPFPGLLARAKIWENPRLEHKILAFWANCLCQLGKATQALNLLGEAQGFELCLARSLALQLLEKPQEALLQLPARPSEREPLLRWLALRYRISLQPADLESLLQASSSGAKILPGLLPLAELPKEQADLARYYPLAEVLMSGWQEAIALRLPEIPQLQLKVLGKFEARVLGKQVELTDRQREILALLLLRHDRETIGEAMWPETETKKMRNNLNVQLNMLRKVIEPWGSSTYLFEEGLEHSQVDLWELQQALEIPDAETVLKLYQGPLAAGVDLPLVNDSREELRQAVIDCLFAAVQAAKPETAMGYLERILELDPLYEEALQELLALLLKHGRRREAQRRYRVFTRQLKEDLGLEPLPETQALVPHT